ncbi:TetR/AcrR family transcriptional regulator C-terminal domain-containing protein [Streptomyces sp. NPDC020875]|uniref:TetR/AcrR family transcriptional regulator n=1 Tax=Streptomyces sp. NPDC020875 TaxID=3154898 RepID=UPI0033D02463
MTGGKTRGGTTWNIWLWPEKTPRGEPPLSLDRIATATVALLDEEGIDRLTMRRLADRLDVMAPSLYWHIDTKDNVIDLALDAVFGPPPGGADLSGRSWRDDVQAVVAGIREPLLRHPWATAALASRPPSVGPNFLARMELLQAALVRAGLCGTELKSATWAVFNHVMGFTWSGSTVRVPDAEREAGRELLRDNSDRYPNLVRNDSIYCTGWDDLFTDGLEFLLDGISARLAAGTVAAGAGSGTAGKGPGAGSGTAATGSGTAGAGAEGPGAGPEGARKEPVRAEAALPES